MKRTICTLIVALTCICAQAGGELGLRTVVIDPGHGGNDPGAVSRDRKNYEKTFTLDISKRLAELIRSSYPGVKVVLTRTSDRFVSLNDRAEIANKAGADLFISIHINSTGSSSPNGYSLHILGQSSNKNRDLFAYNMDVCKRENSVILLEENYSTKYQGFDPADTESYIFMALMQNAHLEQSLKLSQIMQKELSKGPVKGDRGVWQNPFYVLWKTSMPSVLVELGFISNQGDLAVLKNAERRAEMAECLFNAFKKYKGIYDGSLENDSVKAAVAKENADAKAKPEESKASDAKPKEGAEARQFGVQIMAGKTDIKSSSPAFMGYTPRKIHKGGIIKYVIGVSSSREQAEKNLLQIKKKYPGAFVVEIPAE